MKDVAQSLRYLLQCKAMYELPAFLQSSTNSSEDNICELFLSLLTAPVGKGARMGHACLVIALLETKNNQQSHHPLLALATEEEFPAIGSTEK
eukprot:scaffold22029_cov15-Prasinocladus_malaysianus.AAC.1